MSLPSIGGLWSALARNLPAASSSRSPDSTPPYRHTPLILTQEGGGGSGRWTRRNAKFLEEAELLGQPSTRRMGSVIMVTSGGVRITACTRRGGEGGRTGGRRADTNQRRPCTQPRSASARNFRKPGLLSAFVGFASHQNGGTGTNQQDHRRTRGI